MEIEAARQNDDFLAGIEVPIDLQRSTSTGSSESCSSDNQDSSGQRISNDPGSRRNSNGSQRTPGSRKNSTSKNDVEKILNGGQSGVGSAGQISIKVPPATAFKKDSCKKGFGDRKSRAAQGRGLTKKQGGGGSFTWGKPGCELSDQAAKLKGTDDPNYDPFEDPNIVFDALEIEPSTEEIWSSLDDTIGEYFNHASLADFFEAIESLLIRKHRDRILERLIEISLEHKNEYRELSSKCIRYFIVETYLTEIDVAKAFCNLLDRLPDLILDTPDAPEIIGKFIARADSDSCLPTDFLEKERYQATDALVRRSLDYCYALTKDPRSVQTCWGTAIGGFTDTSTLSEKIRELLKEFVSSGDKDEATRCLKDLDVPHYHHELVYEAILISMEEEDDRVINSMTWLLQYMYKEGVVSIDQMQVGFSRFYANVDDILLDIPHVYNHLEKMVQRAAQRNLISSKVRLMCPNRSRKRFSSESDVNGYRCELDIRGSADRPRLSSVGVQSGLDSLPEDIHIE